MDYPYRGSGQVYYNDKNYRCDIYYNDDMGGIVLKINVHNEKIFGDFLELPFELKFLCGQMDNGFRFTLLQLSRIKMEDLVSEEKSVYTFFANYLISGVGQEDGHEPTFYKVIYTLSDVIEWGEESAYNISENFELTHKKEEPRILICNKENFSVTYRVCGTSLPVVEQELLREKIELKQYGCIEIESDEEKELKYFNEIFSKIKELIEISMLKKLIVNNMTAYSHHITIDIGEAKIERNVEILGERIQKTDTKDSSNISWKWLELNKLIELNAFSRYFDKQEKLSPIIELYLETLHSVESSRTRRFLNIVQALETYHSRFITNNIGVFKNRIENIVKGQSTELAEKNRKFLLANSNNFITLESRLADLLLAEHKARFNSGDIKYSEFPGVIAATRNYYIHYDENIKKKHRILSEEKLGLYNRELIKILEYYIMLELGFPADNNENRKKLNDRWGNLYVALDVLNASKKQHGTIKNHEK